MKNQQSRNKRLNKHLKKRVIFLEEQVRELQRLNAAIQNESYKIRINAEEDYSNLLIDYVKLRQECTVLKEDNLKLRQERNKEVKHYKHKLNRSEATKAKAVNDLSSLKEDYDLLLQDYVKLK